MRVTSLFGCPQRVHGGCARASGPGQQVPSETKPAWPALPCPGGGWECHPVRGTVQASGKRRSWPSPTEGRHRGFQGAGCRHTAPDGSAHAPEPSVFGGLLGADGAETLSRSLRPIREDRDRVNTHRSAELGRVLGRKPEDKVDGHGGLCSGRWSELAHGVGTAGHAAAAWGPPGEERGAEPESRSCRPHSGLPVCDKSFHSSRDEDRRSRGPAWRAGRGGAGRAGNAGPPAPAAHGLGE